MSSQNYINVSDDAAYKESYKNDNYKIFTLNLQPDEQTQMHQHLNSTMYVCLSDIKILEKLQNGGEVNTSASAKTLIPRSYDLSKAIHQWTAKDMELSCLGIESSKLYNNLSIRPVALPKEIVKQTISNKYFNAYKLYVNNTTVNIDIKKNGILVSLNDTNGNVFINDNAVEDKTKGKYTNLNPNDKLKLESLTDSYLLLVEFH